MKTVRYWCAYFCGVACRATAAVVLLSAVTLGLLSPSVLPNSPSEELPPPDRPARRIWAWPLRLVLLPVLVGSTLGLAVVQILYQALAGWARWGETMLMWTSGRTPMVRTLEPPDYTVVECKPASLLPSAPALVLTLVVLLFLNARRLGWI